jgi:hypothetical protein
MPLLRFGFTREEPGPGTSRQPTPVVFEPASPQRWEYRVVAIDTREEAPLDDARLNTLGAEGWLLAGVITLPGRSDAQHILYHFVRSA